MRKLILACGFLGILGCASNVVDSKPMNFALVALDQAVESAMSMGITGYSENHREFYSRPFQIAQSDEALHANFRERGIAKVIVLGDSRPYTVEVEVRIERAKNQKDPGDMRYKFVRYDQRLAYKLLQSILSVVEHRERDKNVIDDFRSF